LTTWPEPVERIAAFLRASGAEGRIEELPAGVDEPPGPALRAAGFECDGRTLVVLLPAERSVDSDKVARVAGCRALHSTPSPPFPFQSARVFVDRSVLTTAAVWLEAGSPRHVLGLSPNQLLRLTRSESADLVLEARSGEVDDRGQG
jgi:prolyl-tRNA editing enzyme YbaK/EbsC (Cys-tRNA(Pro) deacylase)